MYHIGNKGVRGLDLFHSTRDYSRYWDRLGDYLLEMRIKIVAIALMPNHFHIQTAILKRRDRLETLMRKIGTSYARYYNLKYQKTGHVFEKRYFRRVVNREIYLVHLAKYIFQNPLDLVDTTYWKKAVKFMREYKWSSYRMYVDSERPEWLNRTVLLGYFRDKKEFQDYMETPLRKWERKFVTRGPSSDDDDNKDIF